MTVTQVYFENKYINRLLHYMLTQLSDESIMNRVRIKYINESAFCRITTFILRLINKSKHAARQVFQPQLS